MAINIDVLKSIMNTCDDKHNTLLYFLDCDIQKKINKYKYTLFEDLYLNDQIILINKSTLQIDILGKINYIDNKIGSLKNKIGNLKNKIGSLKNKIGILKNNRTIYYDPQYYHIFSKHNNNKNKDVSYFEELLKQLG